MVTTKMNLSTLRNAIITKVLTIDGYRLVPFPLETFDRSQNTLAHLGFAVSLQNTAALNERQRVNTRIFMQTTIALVFAYRIRPHSISADYNNAMDAEINLIQTILGTYETPSGMEIRYNQSTRAFADSLEYVIINLEFLAIHTP